MQTFINMGVNMGVLPTKGLTLPLLSFGGSGIVANCIALAILLRIDYENRQILRGLPYERRYGAMTATVMITTGGTGGHVFPGLAVAAKLIARGCRVFWLGTREGMEARLVPQHGVDFESVSFRGVRGKGLRTLLLGPFALLARMHRRACASSGAGARRRARLRRLRVVPRRADGRRQRQAARSCTTPTRSRGSPTASSRYGADRVLLGFPRRVARRRVEARDVGRQSAARRRSSRSRRPRSASPDRAGPLRLLVVGGSLGARH